MKILFPLAAAALLQLACPSILAGEGLESLGNTDGVLTWTLGNLEPGETARRTVYLSYADTREDLLALLASIPPEGDPAEEAAEPTQVEENLEPQWIRHGATDFALNRWGAFFWEGDRQAFGSPQGGLLSRFAYWVHYNDGEPKDAGVSITNPAEVLNLRIKQPLRALAATELSVVLETEDGHLVLQIRASVTKKTLVRIQFAFQNASQATLAEVRLSVYSNLEAAHDAENDYSVLDPEIEGLLFLDGPTGVCAALSGAKTPTSGYAGNWPSEKRLRNGAGVTYKEWPPFSLPQLLDQKLVRAAIPHPPALHLEPTEPETRTLSEVEAERILEEDYLFQAEGEPWAQRAIREIEWTRQLAARIAALPNAPSLEDELAGLDRLEKEISAASRDATSESNERELYLAIRRIKRQVAFKNPLIDFEELLFIDNPYPEGAEWPHEARHRNGMMAVPGGRLLVLKGLHPGGGVRKLMPAKPGSFWRPDLSFDASKVLVSFKPYDEKSFHLYELNLDGTGMRRLTFGDYDDLDPIYLPDGHILFSTSRCNTYIRCMPYTYAYVLARCDPDGKNIYLISQGNEPDWLPTLLDDGRVIYTRWEYTDKALWRIQSLWTVNQDGTNASAFWGNQSVWPDMLIEPRPIPGSSRVMFVGAAHHNWFDGSVGIIDPTKGFNFPDGLTKVTADVPWPECGPPPEDPIESPSYHTAGPYDAYKSPFPLGEEDFLVSARREGKYRLYLMDVHGNRELIYEGAHHIWHALPVRPRAKPPTQENRVVWPGTGVDRRATEPGVFLNPNVYEAAPDLPAGSVKYVRVIQMDAKTGSTWTRDVEPNWFSGPVVSILQADGVKRILGTAPVHPDGSFFVEVPAGKALHFQLLDEHYRALQTMRSFSGVLPGERRGCVGCHESHSRAPFNRSSLAQLNPPARLEPPPWGNETVSYAKFVQPALDRYCAECHQNEGEGKKSLDLTYRPGKGVFCEPYVSLVMGGIAGAMKVEDFDQRDPNSYKTFRPLQHLSYTSRLIDIAMDDEHYGVKVDGVSLQKLIAWVDTNCVYRGEEDLRAIPDPEFAGIEELPIRPLCMNAPIVERP